MSDEPTICTQCKMAPVEGCNGTGKFIKKMPEVSSGPDWTAPIVTDCPNIRRKMLREHLGPEIWGVQHVVNSPLFFKREDGKLVDWTRKNTVIQGIRWKGLLPHLKWALSARGVEHFFNITDDQRLLNIYLGTEDFRSRPKSQREVIPTFNGITDVVGRDYHLVIIRVGRLGYKNIAAPGVLLEALMHREVLKRPTWIVIEPGRTWEHSNDYDVRKYVDENFRILELSEDESLTQEEDDDSDFAVDALEGQVEVRERPATKIQFEPTPEPEHHVGGDDLMNDPTIMGGGGSNKNRRKW